MILVTGAAGKTGKAVVKALATKGVARARVGAQPANMSAALQALGAAEVSVGGFEDTEALARATMACGRSITSVPTSAATRLRTHARSSPRRKAQGVKRFVYHSVLHPQIEAMPHHWAKMQTETCCLARVSI